MKPLARPIFRRAALSLAVVSAAGALAACGGSSGGGGIATAAGSAGAPKHGGNLIYEDAEFPISAQVQESGYWQDRAILENVLDRLIYRTPSGKLEPWIATKWTESTDGLKYTFWIRSGVTYSDGQPLNVQSVKQNLLWQIHGDKKAGIPPNSAYPTSATVADDPASGTVTVLLSKPYAPFLNVLTSWSAGLVATKTINLSLTQQEQFQNLIGSGPFVVTKVVPDKEYVLTARKGYTWGPPSWPNHGQAYLSTVTIIPVLEDSTRLGALQANQADLLRYVQPDEVKGLEKQGYQVISREGLGLTNQWFIRQTASSDLQSLWVRRALLVGINRPALISELYTENWGAATDLVSPGTLGYVNRSSQLAYNPTEAEADLAKAGWTTRNAQGYLVKDGQELTVQTYLDVFDNTAPQLFQAIQAQLKQIGVYLNIHSTDYSAYDQAAFDNESVGVLRTGWPDPDPAEDLYNQYGPAGSNLLGVTGAAASTVDHLLAAPLTAPSLTSEAADVRNLDSYLLDQALVIPILNDSQVYVATPSLHGFSLTDGGLPLYVNAWLS